jgi:endonuclease YncB( thermonuclease family)
MVAAKITMGALFGAVLIILGMSVFGVFTSGVPLVVNGSTLMFDDEVIVLEGVTAPELTGSCTRNGVEWPCGVLSAASLKSIIGERSLWCIERSRAAGGMTIATCYMGIRDVAERQVEDGWAMHAKGPMPRYVREEEKAKRRGAGLWRSSPLDVNAIVASEGKR